MIFKQVCMTVMAFSSARSASIQSYQTDKLAVHPATSRSEIMIERDNQDPEAWYVSLAKLGFENAQKPPVYYPSVKTQEELLDVLSKAWEFHRQTEPPAPFLTRCVEPLIISPTPFDSDDASTSPQSALPLRRQTDALRQTTPRPV